MEELYLEKFFKKKEDVFSETKSHKTLESVEEKPLSSGGSQLFFFLRLFKEDCQKYFTRAPYLKRSLKKLEESLEEGQYTQALFIMDELEELLDIAHREKS